MTMITRETVEPIVANHTGNVLFRQALESASRKDEIVRVLGNYIQFNGVFGGGVANLAGELAIRQDLFRDPRETESLIGDRSTEVASKVFAAAIDEFDDRKKPHLDTHRMLAQATLKGVAAYFGYGSADLNGLIGPTVPTELAIRLVKDGYGINRGLTDQRLFQGLGFHMGSELLADQEFNILDEHLNAKHRGLVTFLKNTKVELSGNEHDAYYWVFIHTSVEADHFDHAADAANTALAFYAGDEKLSTVQDWIIEGLVDFSKTQHGFMEGLIPSGL